MISIPHSYADWADVLDILREKTDDAEVLQAMQQGTIAWQTGVAERFAARLIDTVNERMNKASEKFQKDISRASGSESALIGALLSLRKEMSFLYQVMDIQALPEKDREHYKGLVRSQADQMQKSLEDSAKRDRTGKLSSIIRNHKVNNF